MREGQFELVDLLVESWEELGAPQFGHNLRRFGFTTLGKIAGPSETDSEATP